MRNNRMKIKEILWQNRRDFEAIFECEGCGATERIEDCYDDSNYHNKIIPKLKCKKCGKTSKEIGVDYRPLTTKYPEGMDI